MFTFLFEDTGLSSKDTGLFSESVGLFSESVGLFSEYKAFFGNPAFCGRMCVAVSQCPAVVVTEYKRSLQKYRALFRNTGLFSEHTALFGIPACCGRVRMTLAQCLAVAGTGWERAGGNCGGSDFVVGSCTALPRPCVLL